ncbi:hypothetical protein C8A00DRAFT_15596 [Chaetomidium leptoderma]|uniref:Uncharacterized protein n=1 Tax=Chaetomidium leptoderma TaxID=669021 RepID=A0AAN6VKW4_9PEZI|nr:hypothetical protein C8A00DRAFT_15596 [Chaetomidium leptoderma]
MATHAVEAEGDIVESCIVVGGREVSRPRNPTPQKKASTSPAKMKPGKKAQAQAPTAVKRPRGRPRKPRNNTADTAIVLSDSESAREDAANNQASRDSLKRPSTKVETPTPAPNPKRLAGSRNEPVLSPPDSKTVSPVAERAELGHVQQQLASEKKRRADAEADKAEMQRLLEEKDSSWASEMAAQRMLIQAQLQKFVHEKQLLEAACKDLETRLEVASGKNQEYEASLSALMSTAPTNDETEARIREKDALINNQAADIEKLKQIDAARGEELGWASQEVTTVTEDFLALTTRHAAAIKLTQEHETKIRHLTHELSEAKRKNAAVTADNTRTAASNIETEQRLAQAERQHAGTKANVADLQCKLAASEEKLQTSSASASKDMATLRRQLEKYKKALAVSSEEATKRTASLQKELNNHKEKVHNLQRDAELARIGYKRLVDEATTREAQIRDKIAQMTHDLAVSEAEVKKLCESLAKQSTAKDSLEKDMAVQGTKLMRVQAELKKEHLAMVAKQQEVQVFRQNKEMTQMMLAKLENEIEAQREALQQRNILVAQKEQIITANRAGIQQLRETVSTVTAEKTKVKDDIAVERGKCLQLSAQLAQLMYENEALKTANTEKDQAIGHLRERLVEVDHKREAIYKQLTAERAEVAKKLQFELSASATALQQLHQAAATANEDTFRKNLATLEAEKATADELATALDAQVKQLTTQIADAAASADRDAEERVAKLTQANTELEKERAAQAAELERLKQKLAEVAEAVEALEEDLIRKDGCIGKVREFVKGLPEWMNSTLL